MWVCMPIVYSSFRKGSHQLIRVFVVTPAHWASSCLLIALIKRYYLRYLTIILSMAKYDTYNG